MNRKRNVSYIKPEDPEFLKVLKRQAGYDDRNHKFDKLENTEEDFVDDTDNEKPQVVVLKEGDLTAEEADLEKKRIDKIVSETKANLNERVIFKRKLTSNSTNPSKASKSTPKESKKKKYNKRQLLSFGDDDGDDVGSSE
ncbi:uncharacterized protein KIAA1143 homolog [Galleria mellonella]|uniref:Uncharacterized protein KIAA1143 homolog n=1 Tax=Galleria mellonella TaxID=7137 RepID=A0A6J1WLM2_GALME|nr:uncharacterized protein KIAA1143 homolog [Galleria mellonella]